MRKDRILALAAVIEAQPHADVNSSSGFCMKTFVHPCGTPSCMAGFAEALADHDQTFDRNAAFADHSPHQSSHFHAAKKYLDITDHTARRLFYPYHRDQHSLVMDFTPEEAATVLRTYAETGKIVYPERFM